MIEEKIDNVLTNLGFGCWHILHFAACSFASAIIVPHTLAGVYVAPRLEYECRLPPDMEDRSYSTSNSTIDSCSYLERYQNGTFNEVPCTEWDYDNSTFSNTITSEFGLTCHNDYLRATYQSMYMIGVLVGSPINGILADRYGRKTIFAGAALLYALIGNISCWLPNFSSLLVFRFLLGTLHTAILKTGYILALEIANPRLRSFIGVVLFAPWGLGTMMWGGLAYLLRSWRYLLTAGSTASLILLLPLWFLDESPRWLVVKGKNDRAYEVLKKAARWNGVPVPSESDLMMLSPSQKNEDKVPVTKGSTVKSNWRTVVHNFISNILILLRTPRLRLATFVMILDYLALGIVFFGLSLGGGNFSFDIFSYMALMGVVELPAYSILYPIISRFGRKLSIAVCYIITGIVLLIQPFVPSSHQWFVMLLLFTGKMAITMSFQGNNLFATELFPTEVRTSGVGVAFMFSRVGSSVAPFITDYLGVMYPWAPSVVFGITSTVAGLATLTLWETVGISLPDTIIQLESPDFLPLKKKSTYTGV